MTRPTRIDVRRATVADLDAVVPLFEAYRAFYGMPPDAAAARAFLEARLAAGESVVLLAELDPPPAAGGEHAIGFAQLYPSFSSLSLGTAVVLNDLFVVPSARRLGAAGRLVDEAAAYARRAGALRLELATQHTNRAALELYLARGFVADTEFAHLSLELSG